MAAASPSNTRAGPSKLVEVDAGHLHHRALRGQRARAARRCRPARGSGRTAGGRPRRRARAGRSSARFSATVRPVTVISSPWSSPASSSIRHDHRDAADAVEVDHVVLAVGLGVGEVRHPGGDLVEVVELQLDLGLVGDGQQVEHGVGGAAEGHDHGDGVLERRLGQDVAGPDVLAQQVRAPRCRRRRRSRRGGGRPRAPRPSRAATCRAPRRPTPWCWR